MLDLNPAEIRVLGCLIEKQRTTPDAYPLTLNSLRLACNQATNRDPVLELDEPTIRAALERLARRRYVRLASGHTTRATKYRHLLDDKLSLGGPELSVLAILMLRGPQTAGELRQRSERLHRFASHEELEAVLDRLAQRELASRLERRPGQKEQRYRHLMDSDGEEEVAAPAAAAPAQSAPQAPAESMSSRLEAVERDLADLRAELADLRAQLGG
jgi:uncharacterized protein